VVVEAARARGWVWLLVPLGTRVDVVVVEALRRRVLDMVVGIGLREGGRALCGCTGEPVRLLRDSRQDFRLLVRGESAIGGEDG